MIAPLLKFAARLFGIRPPKRTYRKRVQRHYGRRLTPHDRPQIAKIKRAVCDHFGLEAGAMTCAARNVHIVRPRQLAMYLCREVADESYPAIGRAFDRDHSTIHHAHRKIQLLMHTDPAFAVVVAAIRVSLECEASA